MTGKIDSKSLPIEPLFDNILIEPIEETEFKTPSGLYTVDTRDADRPLIGIVRAVGKGEWIEKGKQVKSGIYVKVGDKVLYRTWTKSSIKYENKDLAVVKQIDIAAKLNF